MFNAAADAVSTLLYGSFSPQTHAARHGALAATNPRFAAARDALWAAAAHQRLSDSAAALLAGNPALDNDAVRALTATSPPTAA